MRKWINILLCVLLGFCSWQGIAVERTPSFKLQAEDNWLLGRPQNYNLMEKFFKKKGDCQIILNSWFIYDSKAGQRLDLESVSRHYPDLTSIQPTAQCTMQVSGQELSEALQITLPTEPGPVLIYFDFVGSDLLKAFFDDAYILDKQQKLNQLGAYRKLPKYFILTPEEGM